MFERFRQFSPRDVGTPMAFLILWSGLGIACPGQDTSAWLGGLFGDRPRTRLVDIVLPGTHDAGSYGIRPGSPVAPGQPAIYGRLGAVAAAWSKTQERDLEHQLKDGIRYLDLRIAHIDDGFVLVHGLVSCPLEPALRGVARFARRRPKEIVLLDMQAMPSPKTQAALDALIQRCLGRHLLHLEGDIGAWTLGAAWSTGRGLLLLSRDKGFARRRREYRPRTDLDSVWTNSLDVPTMRKRLDKRIKERDRKRLQCAYITLTPNAATMIKAPLRGVGGLLGLSRPLFKLPGRWLPEWLKRGWRPNVIAVDFYHRTNVVDAAIAANRSWMR